MRDASERPSLGRTIVEAAVLLGLVPGATTGIRTESVLLAALGAVVASRNIPQSPEESGRFREAVTALLDRPDDEEALRDLLERIKDRRARELEHRARHARDGAEVGATDRDEAAPVLRRRAARSSR